MIKIHKHIEKKVLQDYFFIEGITDIDSKYFINKIKEGFKREDNLSYKTNVKDQMTSWNYFNEDSEFLKTMENLIKYVDTHISFPKYSIKDSWGFCVSSGNHTVEHDHIPTLWSGVIYLNEHNQTLDFNQINKRVKPEKGKFALFSSSLKHGCLSHNNKETKWGISFNMSS
jgi:hypothetical protein